MTTARCAILGMVLAGAVACGDSDAGAGDGTGADTDGGGDAGAADAEAMANVDAGGGDAGGGDAGAAAADAGAGDEGDAAADGGATGDAVARFCERLLERICEWAVDCRPFAACDDWGGIGTFRDSCAALPAAVAAGRVAFDADEANDCVSDAIVCDTETPFTVCDAVFTGLQEAGEECFDSLYSGVECASGICHRQDSACPGTCLGFVELGGECDPEPCVEGARCKDGTCQPLPALGQPCDDGIFCAPGLDCSPDGSACVEHVDEGDSCDDLHLCPWSQLCKDGSCQDRAEGDACTVDDQCPAGTGCRYIDPDTVCAPLVGEGEVCEPDVVFCEDYGWCGFDGNDFVCFLQGEAGESCEPVGCGAGTYCKYEPGATQAEDGMCVPAGSEGDSCDNAAGPRVDEGERCAGELWCNAGTCSGPSGEGGACSLAAWQVTCQEGLWCDVDVCRQPGAEGGPCDPNGRLTCATGLWCGSDATCHTSAAQGEACDANFEFSCGDGFYCEAETTWPDGTCEPQHALGEECSLDDSCVDGLQCSSDGIGPPHCQPPVERCTGAP